MYSLSVHTVIWDPSDFRLRKKMRKVTVLPAVAYCSLVERHHYRWAYCLYLLHWWKQRFLWKFGARLPDCTASQEDSNAEENITSIKRCRKIPSMIACSSQGTLIKVCVMSHCSVLFCVQLGKHTITEASVDHCKLPCVASYTSLVRGYRQVGVGRGVAWREDGYCKVCRCV